MRPYCFLPALCLAVSVPIGRAQETNAPASAAQLAEISARGRALAEYDSASWWATDAVKALKPDETKVRRYLARKTKDGWMVVFGKLNDAQSVFLVAHEATAATATGPFHVVTYDPPQEDRDYFVRAARATDLAIAQFGQHNRPYNVAALPATNEQWWVYVIPAPTQVGVWPLGGDTRNLVSPDGMQVRETRVLHKSIIEQAPPGGERTEFGYHTAVLANVPEDTDVFHVLVREPRVPEYVLAPDFMYKIETNGVIRFMMTREEFLKKKR